MKILYLSDTKRDKTSGIAQKFLIQSDQWVTLGKLYKKTTKEEVLK